jgi:hypothetical protein
MLIVFSDLFLSVQNTVLFLKVPKREIFDRSDFPDFYTIKSLRVGILGVKIKKNVKIFRGSFRGAKFLRRMLSLFSRRFFF